jgi:hypothetical protein
MLGLILAGCAAEEPTEAPTLTRVQSEVFDASCAFSSCHGDGGGSGDLSLVDGTSYGELVGVAADIDSAVIRVVPGDADASFLVAKLENTQDPETQGDAMPTTGGGLDDERLQLVRDWIEAGAADD